MYYLLKSPILEKYNIFCSIKEDTTGANNLIEDCFSDWHRLDDNRRTDLDQLLGELNNEVVCTFETSDFHEFKSQFPELFI